MFLLDTNVLSALMSAGGAPAVRAWISGQPADRLVTTAICQAEILAGLAIMPEGRRRDGLEAAARAMFEEDFDGRIWTFDSDAAAAYARILALRREAGRPIAPIDLAIAAIALSRGAVVVTRNVPDFLGCGFAVVDPWTAG